MISGAQFSQAMQREKFSLSHLLLMSLIFPNSFISSGDLIDNFTAWVGSEKI